MLIISYLLIKAETVGITTFEKIWNLNVIFSSVPFLPSSVLIHLHPLLISPPLQAVIYPPANKLHES
jgi:hypothetical protein